MLLKGPVLEEHLDEINRLYARELHHRIVSATYFGILDDQVLQAVGAVKCYMGHWYLRGCVVKPQYRGQGLQEKLIKERIEYLVQRTDRVRVAVETTNAHSIANVERTGFEFLKTKRFKDGKLVNVYEKRFGKK